MKIFHNYDTAAPTKVKTVNVKLEWRQRSPFNATQVIIECKNTI